MRGTVQGVGFRPWIYRLATVTGVGGRVRNDGRGVTIEIFGTTDELDAFLSTLRGPAPAAARIDDIRIEPLAVESTDTFAI
ncbi:MAG TPA: acylphosphatase, partial [Thermoanaerobaculia bacterium]|nr:acylphosphatase [Thermoanaerobaculia bacterium]